MFGKAVSIRAIGAFASHDARAKKKAKLAESAPKAFDIIIAKRNTVVENDGNAAPATASLANFPSDKYRTGADMPVRDSSFVGKYVLYLLQDGKGGAFKWKKFSVPAAKKPKRGDATGCELKAPAFKFTLAVGKIPRRTKAPT